MDDTFQWGLYVVNEGVNIDTNGNYGSSIRMTSRNGFFENDLYIGLGGSQSTVNEGPFRDDVNNDRKTFRQLRGSASSGQGSDCQTGDYLGHYCTCTKA